MIGILYGVARPLTGVWASPLCTKRLEPPFATGFQPTHYREYALILRHAQVPLWVGDACGDAPLMVTLAGVDACGFEYGL